MLPKKNRVNKKEFANILQKGKFVNSPNLTLKFVFNKEATLPQVAFVAPKGIAKKAVERNLLKRRGYMVVKKFIQTLPSNFRGAFFFGKKSHDNFSGRKNKDFNPLLNLENEIKEIFNKIN